MRGIWYVIAEVAALLAVSGLIGVAIGWLAGRSRSAPPVVDDGAEASKRIAVLEEELRLAARHITETEQRAAEAERRLDLAVDRIEESVRVAPPEVSFGDDDRIGRLEQALEEKTGSIAQLENRLAEQAEKMDRLLERIPAGAEDGGHLGG